MNLLNKVKQKHNIRLHQVFTNINYKNLSIHDLISQFFQQVAGGGSMAVDAQ